MALILGPNYFFGSIYHFGPKFEIEANILGSSESRGLVRSFGLGFRIQGLFFQFWVWGQSVSSVSSPGSSPIFRMCFFHWVGTWS